MKNIRNPLLPTVQIAGALHVAYQLDYVKKQIAAGKLIASWPLICTGDLLCMQGFDVQYFSFHISSNPLKFHGFPENGGAIKSFLGLKAPEGYFSSKPYKDIYVGSSEFCFHETQEDLIEASKQNLATAHPSIEKWFSDEMMLGSFPSIDAELMQKIAEAVLPFLAEQVKNDLNQSTTIVELKSRSPRF